MLKRHPLYSEQEISRWFVVFKNQASHNISYTSFYLSLCNQVVFWLGWPPFLIFSLLDQQGSLRVTCVKKQESIKNTFGTVIFGLVGSTHLKKYARQIFQSFPKMHIKNIFEVSPLSNHHHLVIIFLASTHWPTSRNIQFYYLNRVSPSHSHRTSSSLVFPGLGKVGGERDENITSMESSTVKYIVYV